MRAILPALVCLLLAACGLKDDLYLPDPADTPPPASEETDNEENS